ncbi:hypothetical protein GCM10011409_35790 [Lentibacillus populi]|uniref:Uncharacterized protein n=1 Tax=Lentibacillus populi TaxID=1827502 RepID=A0A9W5U1F5_9BACI|nr:hypothetical protein [Lentibacillus populi]GGB55002.1 hypothetical protein GCM10011409_35790 [Lentibacillus populi]
MSNYIANVENYVELEEKLVELDLSNEKEKIIQEAIDYTNDNLRDDGNGTFGIRKHHSEKDITYDFVFNLFVVEEKDDRYLYYEYCMEV